MEYIYIYTHTYIYIYIPYLLYSLIYQQTFEIKCLLIGHHQLNGYELEQAPGVGDGQGILAYFIPRGRKESDMAE